MSYFPKVLVSRREMVRGRIDVRALIGLAIGMLLCVSADSAQAQRANDRVLAQAQLSVRGRLPEAVILRDRAIVRDEIVAGQREVVVSYRLGGNVPMRLEAVAMGEEDLPAAVRDARGEWVALDRVIIVAREARGAMREVQVQFRLADGAAVPAIRAVADR